MSRHALRTHTSRLQAQKTNSVRLVSPKESSPTHHRELLVARVALHWMLFVGVALALTLGFQFFANPFASVEEQLRDLWRNQGPFGLALLILLPVFIYDSCQSQ